MRAHLLPAADPGAAAGQERWVDATVKTGPKLGERLRPVTDSRVAGDFAVVRGGFGPKPYMRLMRKDGAWKVMGPGDAEAIFGLAQHEGVNLRSIERWAEQEWGGDSPPPAEPPKAKAKAKTKAKAKGKPGGGGAGAKQRGGAPAEAGGTSWIEPIARVYREHLAASEATLPEHHRRDGVRLLNAAGDTASIDAVLDTLTGSVQLEAIGYLAARTKGLLADPASKALLKKHGFNAEGGELHFGLVATLARAADRRALGAAEQVESPPFARIAMAVLLDAAPTPEHLKAFEPKYGTRLDHRNAGPFARALILNGRAADAERVLKMAEAGDRQFSPAGADEGHDFSTALDDVEVAMARAYLEQGAPDQADAIAGRTTNVLVREHVRRLVVAAHAEAGDTAAATAALGRLWPPEATLQPHAHVLIAYPMALKGDADGARRLVTAVPPGWDALHEPAVAFGYGLIAAAQRKAGKPEDAARTLEEVAERIESLPTPADKVLAAVNALFGAVHGPRALDFAGGETSWRRTLPW